MIERLKVLVNILLDDIGECAREPEMMHGVVYEERMRKLARSIKDLAAWRLENQGKLEASMFGTENADFRKGVCACALIERLDKALGITGGAVTIPQ
jgi:hypothetical protein